MHYTDHPLSPISLPGYAFVELANSYMLYSPLWRISPYVAILTNKYKHLPYYVLIANENGSHLTAQAL